MKNLAKLNGAKALSKNEQKVINGGKPPGPTCPGCSHIYGEWLYTSLAGGPTGPGAPCGFGTMSEICYGFVSSSGMSCCSS